MKRYFRLLQRKTIWRAGKTFYSRLGITNNYKLRSSWAFFLYFLLLYCTKKYQEHFKIIKHMESLGTREILTHFTSLLNGQMSCNGLSNRYSGQTTTLFKLYESSSFSSTIQSMMEGWTFIHGFEGACQYLLKAKSKSLSAKSCIHIKKKYHCSPVCKFRFITFGHHIVKWVKNPLGLLQ